MNIQKHEKIDWPSHIENWRASGLTQAEYCRRNELKVHIFRYWKRGHDSHVPEGVPFVALSPSSCLQPSTSSEPLVELRIHEGFRVELRLNIRLNSNGSSS